jgi:hypothetical protein
MRSPLVKPSPKFHGNFELFKVSGKLDLNQVNQIYYTPESAFIELNLV